jgi:general secretion pathway protein D
MRGLSRSVILAGFSTVLAIACAPATAQQPPPAMPAPEGAATTQEVRAASQTRPASTQSSFNFDNAPIAAVLEYLSDTFGYIVVRDQGVTVTGRIGVLSKQPVTPAEVLTVLNTVLKDSTPPLAALQVDRRTIKITTVDLAKKGAIPVYFGADPAAIEPSDNLRTQVIPLRNLDAPKLKLDLASLVSANADLSANAASNSLVMTDTSANVHRIVEIVSAMDKRDAM